MNINNPYRTLKSYIYDYIISLDCMAGKAIILLRNKFRFRKVPEIAQ